jgi:hypothetical protein
MQISRKSTHGIIVPLLEAAMGVIHRVVSPGYDSVYPANYHFGRL